MTFWTQSQNYGYGIGDDEDSSDPGSSSSEDEINIILRGTPDQKRKLKRLHNRLDERHREDDKSSSSEDEFEREMNDELTQHLHNIERNKDAPERLNPAITSKDQGEEGEMFYDDVYFDSDEEGNKGGVDTPESSKHAVISNDDLLYDPTMDDRDQRWVDRQRRRNNNTARVSGSSSQSKQKKPAKLPTSDALLDCPACLTTLCLDCQRHDTYKHQYRAMFVMNCVIDTTQNLECPEQQTKRKKKKKKTSANSDPLSPAPSATDTVLESDLFHPVKCTECNTVVGVVDSDEIYHFFNVLASHT